MTGLFVGLIFGFCAGIADNANDTLLFGYDVQGECVVHMEMTGTNLKEPQSLPEKHSLLWEWLDGGAEVTIDDQKFVIMRFGSA